ncbi:MAG TPA: hypothetical protein DD670_09550 [Planctomycetaceae bacterium]|nr:hypothetical protein [Planctomycetaceae bacterium]
MSVIIGTKESTTRRKSKVGRKQKSREKARRDAKHQIHLPAPVAPGPYFRRKGAFDTALAAVLLVPSLPIIVVTLLLVRLTSPGPGLFRQERVGRDGRVFELYKIRTMREDAEDQTGATWSCPGDPRITPVGKWLRRFHLDEFPQLFNVLRGEMSLVGPRPERPQFVELLSRAVPGYANRLKVRPGITGLAQVNLPPDTDLCCVCRKVAVDIYYIQHGTLAMDVRLILGTFLRIFKIPVAWSLRPLGIERQVKIFGCDTASRTKGNGRVSRNGNGHSIRNGNGNGNGNGKHAAGGMIEFEKLVTRCCTAARRLKEAMDSLPASPCIPVPEPPRVDGRLLEAGADVGGTPISQVEADHTSRESSDAGSTPREPGRDPLPRRPR